MIGQLLDDVRFALRLLRRSPGFTATLLFLLVGGIGATTAMFSVVESLLFAPLPYDHAEELGVVWSSSPGARDHSACSLPDFFDWKTRASDLSVMAAVERGSFSLSAAGARPEGFAGVDVTGDFFALFRAGALRGRLIGPDDDHVGAARVVVVSARLWHEKFASDPALVGTVVSLNNQAYTVIGIAPEGFTFGGTDGRPIDMWAPMAVASVRYAEARDRREEGYLEVLARRRPGVTIAQAQAQLSSIAAAIDADHPEIGSTRSVRLVDLHEEMVEETRGGVLVLFASIALVFLVVCANVANLLLTRGATRRGEMAIRAALGADRSRLMKQLLTETAVLFLVAGVASVVVARVLVAQLAALLPFGGGAAALQVHLDATVLVLSLATSFVFGLVFGLVPAVFVSRVAPDQALKATAARAGTSRSHQLVRGGLVVGQVALAFALLAGAGLALEAFTSLRATNPGFTVEDRVATRFDLSTARYPDDAACRSFVRRVLAIASAQPGVTDAAMNTSIPFGGGSLTSSFTIEGRPPWPRGEEPEIERNVVTPGYFAAMGMPILAGRDLASTDVETARKVIVLSKTAADRFFPGQSALGHRLALDWHGDEPIFSEVVGIVGDVRRRGLARAPVAEAFMPVEQADGNRSFWLVVHSPHAQDLAREFPALVQQADTDQAATWGVTLQTLVAASLGLQRSLTILLGAFAAAGLVLATLGVFGLVSYGTAQRTREIGLRMALGSTPEGVMMMVMRSGLSLVGLGLSVGFVAALAVGRILEEHLAAVHPFDLAVFVTVALILVASGMLACLVPALRAVRIPPASALRYE